MRMKFLINCWELFLSYVMRYQPNWLISHHIRRWWYGAWCNKLENIRTRMIIAGYVQWSSYESKAWKRLERDSNPWPLRYRCSALPAEPSSKLRTGHTVRIYPSSWKNKAWKNLTLVPPTIPTNSKQFEFLRQVSATCSSKRFVWTVRGTSLCDQSFRLNSSGEYSCRD